MFWLTVTGALLVAGIVCGTIATIDRSRERALANAERELSNAALMLAHHFDQQFADSATIASDLIEQLGISKIASSASFGKLMATDSVRRVLRSKSLSYLGDIALFDASGDMVVWSGPPPMPKLNISERAYFQDFRSNPSGPETVAEPVRSYLNGTLNIVIADRLRGENGTFLGVLTRRVVPGNIEKFFASIAAGTGAIVMVHADGTILARHPGGAVLKGEHFPDASLLETVMQKSEAVSVAPAHSAHGDAQIASGYKLTHFPAAVIATNPVGSTLADWYSQSKYIAAIAGLAVVAIAGVLSLIIRLIAQNDRVIQTQLETERERLDTAVNNMVQGLVVYDQAGRVISINRSYLEMFDIPADAIGQDCNFRDLIEMRHAKGHFDGDVDAFCTAVIRDVSTGTVAHTESRAQSGRSFLSINRPLAQGGWVATIEEITERRRLEDERDRNYAFVREIIDHLPALITVKDAQTRGYLLANRTAESYFGLARDQIVGKTANDVLTEHSAQVVTADDEHLMNSSGMTVREEHLWKTPQGQDRYVTSKRIGIRGRDGVIRYIVNMVEDVTDRKAANERIAHLAHFDALTDLPNRAMFRTEIERRWRKAKGAPFALLYIDVDGFKSINDSLGHHIGDIVLKEIAFSLRSCLADGDFIARLGGDEFAIIRKGATSADAVVGFVKSLHTSIRHPFDALGHRLSSDASIGIAFAPHDASDLESLIKHADLAMYAAKAMGRRTFRFFGAEMTEKASRRLSLEQDLREAVARKSFEIHYQPVLDLTSNAIVGCEALLRWRHPERGMVSPADFIPIAEDTGLISEIGEWTLRQACADAATWPTHIRLAVNVSPIQLRSDIFAMTVMGFLMESALDPRRLEIEITEAVLISDDEKALAILHQLKESGVKIALDDFGTGYSSLSYLRRFPFDKIKIDRSFVEDLERNASSTIVKAVINIALSLEMTTTAEGVETEGQREILRKLRCTEMQGYLFSAAKPAAAILELLNESEGFPRQSQVS